MKLKRTLTTAYTVIRYDPAAGSNIKRQTRRRSFDLSGHWSVIAGQHPAYGEELLQHNETSVFGRLGENHGGVERPMDPVSCRTPDEFPQDRFLCFRGSRGQIREDHKKKNRPERTF